MSRYIILLIIFIFPSFGQGIFKVTTDKNNYDYGEKIQVIASLHNDTDSTITVWGSSSCPAEIGMDNIEFWIVCTADTHPFPILPGYTREWSWTLDPKLHAIPTFGGKHVIRGFCENRRDSVIIEAPKFYGGIVRVGLDSNYNVAEIDKLKDSLNATVNFVIDLGDRFIEEWEITGFLVDSLANVLENDMRIKYFSIHRPLQIEKSNYVSIENDLFIPKKFELYQNYPNPFNPSTTISYQVNISGFVTLSVYNLVGELIETLINAEQGVGKYCIDFDATDLPSGVYIYKLISGNTFFAKKMVVLK